MLDSFKNLPAYDVFVIIFLLFCLFRGGMKGVFAQVVSIISAVAGWYLSSRYSSVLEPYIPFQEPLRGTVAVLLSFILITVVLRILGSFIGAFFKFGVLKGVNRQLGALFGGIKGIIFCLVITFFAVIASDLTKKIVIGSQSGKAMIIMIYQIQKVIPDNAQHEQVRKAMEEFTKAAGGEEALNKASEDYQISAFKDDIAKSYAKLKEQGTALKETADGIRSLSDAVNSFNQKISDSGSDSSDGSGIFQSLSSAFKKSGSEPASVSAPAVLPGSSVPFASPVPAETSTQTAVMAETDSVLSSNSAVTITPYSTGDSAPALFDTPTGSDAYSWNGGGGSTFGPGGGSAAYGPTY